MARRPPATSQDQYGRTYGRRRLKTLTAIPCAYCSSRPGREARFRCAAGLKPGRPSVAARPGVATTPRRAPWSAGVQALQPLDLGPGREPATTRARPARPRRSGPGRIAEEPEDGRRHRLGIPGRNQEAVLLVADELGLPIASRCHDRRLHRQGLAESAGDPQSLRGRRRPRPGTAASTAGTSSAVAPDRDRIAQAQAPGEGLERRPLLGARSHQEQARVRARLADARERPEQIVVPLGLPDADLRDQGRARDEAELPPDRGPVDASRDRSASVSVPE